MAVSAVATASASFVALVLAWAGAAKLAAPSRTAAGFRSLGVPAAGAVAVVVPLAELVAAVLLLAAPAAGAALSVALLAAFTVFLATALRRGASVPCGCFGSARPAPITYAALLRNGLLALPAGTAALAAPLTLPGLDAVLAVGAAAAIGMVVVALVEVHATTGSLWDNRLPTGPGDAA